MELKLFEYQMWSSIRVTSGFLQPRKEKKSKELYLFKTEKNDIFSLVLCLESCM